MGIVRQAFKDSEREGEIQRGSGLAREPDLGIGGLMAAQRLSIDACRSVIFDVVGIHTHQQSNINNQCSVPTAGSPASAYEAQGLSGKALHWNLQRYLFGEVYFNSHTESFCILVQRRQSDVLSMVFYARDS